MVYIQILRGQKSQALFLFAFEYHDIFKSLSKLPYKKAKQYFEAALCKAT